MMIKDKFDERFPHIDSSNLTIETKVRIISRLYDTVTGEEIYAAENEELVKLLYQEITGKAWRSI